MSGKRAMRPPSANRPSAAIGTSWLDDVRWNADGLVAAIAQDATSHKVLTLAWMNRDALARTRDTREAHYFSRSRNKLWRKGESSGHVQRVREIRLDCDGDAIVLHRRPGRRHRLPHRSRALLLPHARRTARGMRSSPC